MWCMTMDLLEFRMLRFSILGQHPEVRRDCPLSGLRHARSCLGQDCPSSGGGVESEALASVVASRLYVRISYYPDAIVEEHALARSADIDCQ